MAIDDHSIQPLRRKYWKRVLWGGFLIATLLIVGWMAPLSGQWEAETSALAAARRAGVECGREVEAGVPTRDAHARYVAALRQVDISACRYRFRGAYPKYVTLTEQRLAAYDNNQPETVSQHLRQALRQATLGESKSQKLEAELQVQREAAWDHLLKLEDSWAPF